MPYFVLETDTPEEMFRVIEHEEEHTAKGESPGWEGVIKEEKCPPII